MRRIPDEELNEDWIRSVAWDFPGVDTLDGLLAVLGVAQDSRAIQERLVRYFTGLAAWIPAPEQLKLEVGAWLGQDPEHRDAPG